MPIRFDHPEYLLLLLLIGPLVWSGRRYLSWQSPWSRWAAVGLRAAVLTVLALILAGLQVVQWRTDLTVMALVDRSESVRRFVTAPASLPEEAMRAAGAGSLSPTTDQWALAWVGLTGSDRRPDDRLGVVAFDRRSTMLAMPSPRVNLDAPIPPAAGAGTDIASAVRLGLAAFGPDTTRRMVLISDGHDTRVATDAGAMTSSGQSAGRLLAAAREAAAAGVPIDVVPLEYQLDREVMVQGVYAPTETRRGQTIPVRIVLEATRPASGELFLRHRGEPVDLNPLGPGQGSLVGASEWTLQQGGAGEDAAGRYTLVRVVDVPVTDVGVNLFEAIFEPAEGSDQVQANNRGGTFTLVQGQGRILVISDLPDQSARILPEALAQRGLDVEVRPATGLPDRLALMQAFDAVIFQNLPAEFVTPRQQDMLAAYVNELGGGFLMLGGPQSFAPGGWTNSRVDQLLPIACEVPSDIVLPIGALVLVIDRSGSMTGAVPGTGANKQRVANEAAALAITTLYPRDMVGVIAFDNIPQWVVPLQENQDTQGIIDKTLAVAPAGGTSIGPALTAASNALGNLDQRDVAAKHVILLTDGVSQGADYPRIVSTMRERGITLSTVAVGTDVDLNLLNNLAGWGEGKFYHVNDARELPRIFLKEARVIRKNQILEKTFVPTLRATGSPILSGREAFPELQGMVLTGPRVDPRVYMPMVGPDGQPLFAHWQVGLGRTAAFTSDATNRWATSWLDWGGYADFWTRTLRTISRPAASRDFDLAVDVTDERLRVRLDTGGVGGVSPDDPADNAANASASRRTVRGALLEPNGDTRTIELLQTGPGVFEGDFPAQDQGSYIVSLMADDGQGGRSMAFGGATHAGAGELSQFASQRALLEEIAQITGGRVIEPTDLRPNLLFDRTQAVPPVRSIQPMWRSLLFVLIPLLLMDVAARRIDWNLKPLWLRLRALASTMSRPTDPATLDSLKQVREARRREQAQRRAGESPDETGGRARPRDARGDEVAQRVARKAAQEKALNQGAGPVRRPAAESLRPERAADAPPVTSSTRHDSDGADDEARPTTSGKADPGADADTGGTTNRLLAAKRRAREDMKER